ncbi:MAG TPA: protein phosphatase 2C domain-containing protein [Polyangiaceae bacterium]
MNEDAHPVGMTEEASPSRSRVVLRVAARSDVGVERSNNEDRPLVADLVAAQAHAGAIDATLETDNGGALLAVCDGMGGEAGGEIASSTAVDALFRAGVALLPGRSEQDVASGLVEAVKGASRAVESRAAADRTLARMGTTATVCTVAGDALLVAQVGDSRAYLYRAGSLTQLTRDQTLKTLLVERGQLTPEEAGDFQHNNIILQALGHHGGVDVDVGWVGLCRGDVLLVCSDGLFGCVADDAIAQTLGASSEPGAACDALIRLALAAGAPDNVTCVVAQFDGALPPPSAEAPVLNRLELSPARAGDAP